MAPHKTKASFPESANFGGGFFVGTVNTCSSTDDSWFCSFSRILAVIRGFFMILVFCIVLYFVYQWLKDNGWFSFLSHHRK